MHVPLISQLVCYGFGATIMHCTFNIHLYVYKCRLDGKHVVFGRVIDGFDVIKAMEAKGSQSGKTSVPVEIADCGQL